MLGLTGIDGLDTKNPCDVSIGVKPGGMLQISFNEAPVGTVGITLFDTSGRKHTQARLEGGNREYTITTGVPAGVYAVQIDTNGKHQRGSVLVRII